ncbi:hypothetical protein B7P43_G08412 [Cryptotermes secundus]|uniref:Uncharacterized protein n=2 Tax=Cryptotermes secundus TaxID=105785 RepID=A0A2J7PXH9_9NEOP|nr:hypothetical protein B7P43_G08412 [Cryptotermes secundus]
MSTETQRRLKRIYRDVDDIDLFPGAMAERPVSGGLVGPTFACILAQQFSNLRKGDRFWYENGGFESSFTLAQLQQIRRVTLARMLCDNLDGIDTLQPFVFLTVDNDRNHRVPCDSGYIPHLDLKPWAEHRKEEEYHHQESTDHDHSPSHHIPSYPSYQKPPTEQTPSYHHTTRPSYEEHKPSYLIVELQPPPKPLEENKPTYLIDSNFQSKPTKPQNMYTTTKYPKPEQAHKPTYLIDESFEDAERPASKRPNVGHKPINSAYLPVEHKEPDFNNHNYDHGHGAELPSKLETEPPDDYHFHHKEEYAPTKPSGGHNHLSLPEYYEEYNPHHKPQEEFTSNHYEPHGEYLLHHKPDDEHQVVYKPHGEYSHHEPHDEYLSHSKPQYEHTTQSKPYHEYPSHSKPQYEHTTHSKPYHEHPSHSKPQYEHTTSSKPYHEYPSHSKPQYEHTTYSKPYHEYSSHSKPQYEHTTQSKPYHEYSSYSKPHYEHTNQPKPYHEHTTHHYKPQYVYKFNISHVTSSSEPHYEYISFTKPYDNEHIPSTLDYNKYKPRPTKPSSHHDGTYSLLTNPPYKEQHHSESDSSAGRPDYQKPSSSEYYHTSYSYIKVFNEPSYYYLDERKVVGYTNKPNPGLLAEDINTSMVQSDASIMEQEPRIAVDNGYNIPADDDNLYIDLTTLTTSFNSAPLDVVTTEENVANVNTTPDEMQETVLSINIINITEDTDINNTAHNTSNIFYNEKQLNFAENSNVTMSEFMTTLDGTTTVMNAINTETLDNANDNITLKTFINMNKSTDNVTNSEKKNTFIIFSSKRENETDDSNISNQNTTNKNTFSSVDIEQKITENNSHLDNNNVNLDTQTNISVDNNIANENIKSVKEQNKTADNSTILHINKFTHITDANIFSNTNIIIDSNLNTDKQNVSIINETEMDGNINSNTETSEEDTTGMIIHESTFDTILTESYMISTITTESKDDWIFTEEEEDNATIIPEMPTIASDPMALKELPRPMIFEDEESGRGLM